MFNICRPSAATGVDCDRVGANNLQQESILGLHAETYISARTGRSLMTVLE